MPRSGPPSYTYTLPPIYLAIPGTTITAAQHNDPLEDIASTFNSVQPVVWGGTGAANATGARSNLGLGTMATQAASAVAITGGTMADVTVTLKQAANPAPTAEGDIRWSTVQNAIKVGDSSGTQSFWPGAGPGAIMGCTIANNVSDATNDIDFATGQCADATNAALLTLASALTKRLDAAWAVGTNQGGLFSGAIANTTYHCFIIMRPDTGVVDAGFDTSVTAANRPVDYTYYRRVGSIVRSGGAILAFIQNGDYFTWGTQANEYNTSLSASTATMTLTVPTGIVVRASLTVTAYDTSPSDEFQGLLFTALSQADSTPSATNISVGTSFWSFASRWSLNGSAEVWTNTSAQVRRRMVGSTLNNVTINTVGWVDLRS